MQIGADDPSAPVKQQASRQVTAVRFHAVYACMGTLVFICQLAWLVIWAWSCMQSGHRCCTL